MARLTSAEVRGQLSAIAVLRWQMFLHSLRTLGGRLEMVSRIFAFSGFAVMGLGGSIGLGYGAWSFTSHDNIEQLALLFWPILVFWQLFPVMASAFAENVDFSALLRFPLSFPAYALVRVVFGASDPSTLVGSLWLLAIAAGVAIARVSLLPLAVLVCLIFAFFNLFLARAIFSWFERWLATRRAREIMGVVFLAVVISFQFIGPVAGHFSRSGQHPLQFLVLEVLPYERLLPPGLAAAALAYGGAANFLLASATTLLLAAYALGMLWLLVVRLAAQYSGENLGEAAARPAGPVQKAGVRAGWSLPGLSGRVSAIIEKEFHYLSRSGPVLFTLIMPVVVLLIFRFSPGRPGHGESFLVRAPDYAFPVGAAYSMLLLTNILYNALGADGAGIQAFFLLPIRFHEILLAKNIFYGGVVAAEMLIVWTGTALIFRPPSAGVALATLAGAVFAFLTNLAAGNLLSLYTPKRFDTAVLGRQRLPTATVFATLGIQAVVIGLGALVFFLSIQWASIWVAALALFGLAGLALGGYLISLRSVDRIALSRRENLLAELARA